MSAPLRRRLGRGLDALLAGGGVDPAPAEVLPSQREFFLAPIEEVHPGPDQPRQVFDETKLDELAASLRVSGIIQPLLVRERPASEGGGFWLIAGERRWRAAQRAGLHQVPVLVRDVTPAVALEMALVENVQRADLNPIEEAEAYRRLADEFGYTQEQLAERVGKDRTTITNALRLLKLPQAVRALVSEGELSMGHARALLGLDEASEIETAARKVVSKALSVRATEEMVRRERTVAPVTSLRVEKSASVRDLEQRLTRALGARVNIDDRGDKGGRIEITYGNLDELDTVLDRILASSRN